MAKKKYSLAWRQRLSFLDQVLTSPKRRRELAEWKERVEERRSHRPPPPPIGLLHEPPLAMIFSLQGRLGKPIEWDACLLYQTRIEDAIPAEVGYVDLYEIGGGQYTIWIIGPQQDPLFEWLKSFVEGHPAPLPFHIGRVIVPGGDASTPPPLTEEEIKLGEWLQAQNVRLNSTPRPKRVGPKADQMVRIDIPMSSRLGTEEEWNKWAALEDEFRGNVPAELGEHDGNEIGEGEYFIWLFAVKAQEMTPWVVDFLADKDLPPGTKLSIRHGNVNNKRAVVETIPLR